MTPKHKAIVKHMGGGYTDNNGIRHLNKAEQKEKMKHWPRATHVSKAETHREYSRGDTFEGEAKMKKY